MHHASLHVRTCPLPLVKLELVGCTKTSPCDSTGDRRLATRRSLHIPDSHASTSEAEYHKLVEDFKASKVVRVGGAKQVTDQRLEMPSHKSAKDPVEAFRTTHSDVGLFMISRSISQTGP